jgi:hypothetical protein
MATVDVPRSKKHETPQPAKTGKRKSRAFRYAALLTVGVLLVGAYFAPLIIANTPLGQWAVQSALKLDGTVSLGSTSLGWFSGVAVENLEIRDASGDALLTVESLRTDKPLIGLLLDLSDLGQVHVDRPVVHVVARERDSNLEQAFASLLASPDGSRVAAQLEITDGTILIDDVPASRQFRIESLAVTCAISQVDETVALTVSGALSDNKEPGSFKIDLQTRGSAQNETALANGKIDCQLSALPLELLQPLLRRSVEQGQLAGRLTTRLGGAWGEMAEGGESSVSGDVLATQFVFSAAALGADRIELERLEMPCRIAQNGDRVQIEKLAINCSLGTIALSGSAKMSDLSAANRISALAHENYEFKGNIDLTELARMLPTTLRLREGTEITSGHVALVLSSRQQAAGMTWTGRVDASHLEAHENGRKLVWENPLAIEFATHETSAGLVVDQAQCTSSFLQVNAAGSIDDLTASAKFDLAQLVTQLRQFSDLNQLQLAGQGQAQLAWKRAADDQFTAEAAFQARGFQLIAAKSRPWKEDNLVAKLDVSGLLSQQTVKRVDRAQLTVSAGTERLEATLTEAISDPAVIAWPVQCSWRGQLASWAPRLESCLGLTGWDLGGGGGIQATLNCSPKAVDIQLAKAQFDQFQVAGGGWHVSEPSIAVTVEGRWDLAKTHIDVAQGKLTAGSTTALVNHAALQGSAAGWTLDGGTAQIAAELANLYRWRHDPRTPSSWRIAGKLAGDANLKYESGIMTGRIGGTVDQLQVADLARSAAPDAAAVWREPRITFAASGNYQTASQQLQLDKAEIAANALRCDVSGAIATSAQGGNLDLKGTVQYDWEQLAPLWQPFVGPNVQVAGRQTRPFALRGRLSGDPLSSEPWRQITGEASVGWAGMFVDGVGVGPGEIAAQLGDGQLRVQPIDIQVGEGRLTVAPLVRLSPAPAELLLGGGPLLTDIHLSPDLCARGLKFMAPILADSTVADGRFSIVMDGGRIPLSNPRAGDASGRMALKAQAKPGPLAEQFVFLLNELTTILRQGVPLKLNEQSGAVLSIDDANIEFRLVNGRVYHRGLTFMAGTTPITTRGSVGFDESLSMVAEVPIRAKLLGIDLSLGTLEGASVQIPIEGTLANPKLDRHILDQLAGKLLQNATKGVLINEVNKTLEKLFPGQP